MKRKLQKKKKSLQNSHIEIEPKINYSKLSIIISKGKEEVLEVNPEKDDSICLVGRMGIRCVHP